MNAFPLTSTPGSTSGSLQSKACLMTLQIPSWSARALNREETRALNALHNAPAGTASVRQRLLPEDSPEYEELMQAIRRAYKKHEKLTLPWFQKGTGILPVKMTWEYQQEMAAHKAEVAGLLEIFLQAYSRLTDSARDLFKGLFMADKYPPVEVIRAKFAFRTIPLPMPASSSLQIDLEADALAEMRRDLEAELRASLDTAVRDVWVQLHELVVGMVDKLSDANRTLRDPSFARVEEMCRVLEKLNLLEDPNFQTMVERVRWSLTTKPKDASAREEAAAQAASIVSDMEAFMAPW